VGPLPQDRPESGRRKRVTWTGLVIASMPERSWLVLWDPSGQASTHLCRSLKFLEYSTVTDAELHQMQQRFLPRPPEPPAASTITDTTTAHVVVVEQESGGVAPLVTAENIVIAQNNTVEQPVPPAAGAEALLELNPSEERRNEDEVEQAADPDVDENEELHFDGENNNFVGLDNYQDEHHQKWNQYIFEKAALLGVTVTKGQGAKAIMWRVRGDVTNDNIPPGINDEYREVGVCGFDFAGNLTKSHEDAPEHTNLMLLLIHLWPGDWHD